MPYPRQVVWKSAEPRESGGNPERSPDHGVREDGVFARPQLEASAIRNQSVPSRELRTFSAHGLILLFGHFSLRDEVGYLQTLAAREDLSEIAGPKGIYRKEWHSRFPLDASIILRVSDDRPAVIETFPKAHSNLPGPKCYHLKRG